MSVLVEVLSAADIQVKNKTQSNFELEQNQKNELFKEVSFSVKSIFIFAIINTFLLFLSFMHHIFFILSILFTIYFLKRNIAVRMLFELFNYDNNVILFVLNKVFKKKVKLKYYFILAALIAISSYFYFDLLNLIYSILKNNIAINYINEVDNKITFILHFLNLDFKINQPFLNYFYAIMYILLYLPLSIFLIKIYEFVRKSSV